MNPTSTIICPLCKDQVEKLLFRYHFDGERQVIERIGQHNPGWAVNDGACSRCFDYYHTEIVMAHRILPEIGPYFPVKTADDFIVLPTPLRVNTDQRFTGKGVTICFIDSDFYPHPDLVAHRNRIKVTVDITTVGNSHDLTSTGTRGAWHGTMTSVVCAGDGYLSNGLYRGIASDAELVLAKVQNDEGRITTGNLVKALEWVLLNHAKYNIRIINMSLGDEKDGSYKSSEVDRLAELLISEGIVIVAAAGNDENTSIKPPANSPSVITVGGVDDENKLESPSTRLYHSAYGETMDGFMKPELVAHAIWIAAPILPGTRDQQEASLLQNLLALDNDALIQAAKMSIDQTGADRSALEGNDAAVIHDAIVRRIRSCKFISAHYMHVDGTSFAAPLVTSIIAQLLEINPGLTPAMVRSILFTTAKRLESFPAQRQGFGLPSARKSILKALRKNLAKEAQQSPKINQSQNSITFYVQHDCASQVSLAGSFNNWADDLLVLEPVENGVWTIDIPMLPAGKHRYKFLIDENHWVEDVANPLKESDGFNGFNSILIINDNKC